MSATFFFWYAAHRLLWHLRVAYPGLINIQQTPFLSQGRCVERDMGLKKKKKKERSAGPEGLIWGQVVQEDSYIMMS